MAHSILDIEDATEILENVIEKINTYSYEFIHNKPVGAPIPAEVRMLEEWVEDIEAVLSIIEEIE